MKIKWHNDLIRKNAFTSVLWLCFSMFLVIAIMLGSNVIHIINPFSSFGYWYKSIVPLVIHSVFCAAWVANRYVTFS